MNEKGYKKKYEFQKNIISRQSKLINDLKSQIEKLETECKEKDNEIKKFVSLQKEMNDIICKTKKHKKEYEDLIFELKKMKSGINQSVYNGKWNLVKFLIK